MSLDMTTVTGITVPEGTVVQIKDSSNNVLWQTPKRYRKLEYIEAPAPTAKGEYCIQFDDITGRYYTIDYALTTASWATNNDPLTGQYYGGLIASSSGSNNFRGGYADHWNSKFTWQFSTSTATNMNSTLWNTNRHVVSTSYDTNQGAVFVYVDGTRQINCGSSASFSNHPSLFNQKYDNSQWSIRAKVYSFTMRPDTTSGTTYYIYPAQNRITGEIGMYCEQTNRFYTNAGTGTFIAGPTLTEEWM